MSAIENDIEESKPYEYYEQQITSKIHHYYLSQSIADPTHYIAMIHQIRSAAPHDIVHIHLNTPGGRLDTGVQLVNAMRASEAHVVCSLESEAHSLGTLIFLAADEFIVHDNCMMMFHNYSGGTWGKGNEQIAQLSATIKWFNDLAQDIYVPFLTEDELEGILRGDDLWIHSTEIRSRLENMVEIIKQEHEEKELEKEREEKAKTKKAAPKKRARRATS